MTCGIYKITNKINNHSYIGMSNNIERRWKEHIQKSNHPCKPDEFKSALYNAFRKYKVENFSFDIIEECAQKDLKEREIFWIQYYNTYNNREDYNETPGGDSIGEKGIHKGEEHGMSKLTEQEVIFCREQYQLGARSREIYNKYFSTKISYSGFLRMWHGDNWKEVMPEVFNINPHPAKYSAEDRDTIRNRFFESGLSLRAFQKTNECYVGYGTLYNMVHNPSFYDNK